MKKIIITILLSLYGFAQLLACEVCRANQPEILQDITHGPGPQGTIDYIITWSAAIIVGITFILSLKYLCFPKKHDDDHIKYLPVNENQ